MSIGRPSPPYGPSRERIQLLQAEADELHTEIAALVHAAAPWLPELPGVGPISAAQVLVSWSHAGRLRSERRSRPWPGSVRSQLRLGSTPVTGSNRSGDRQLNRALHTITQARLRDDPLTCAYAARRTAEGRTTREIRRCLKRFIARQLFKLLERYDQPALEILLAA